MELPANLPPGTYYLYIGFYDPDSLERLFVAGSDDNSVMVAEIE